MKRVSAGKANQKRRPRRSERRLGKSAAVMQSSVSGKTLGLKQAQTFWRVNQSRFAGILVLALCLWIIYLLFSDDAFYVYGAEISGNHILNAEEIYRAGEINNQSVFWINPNRVKENIEAMPNIRTAQINITVPANIAIKVEERQPEVIWQTGDQIWWVDNEGTFVPPPAEAETEDNRLRIIDQDTIPIQANAQADPLVIRGAQTLHELRPDVSELYHNKALGLVYFTPEGWAVYLGSGSQISEKLVVADAMRADLQIRGITPAFIDVRSPLRAVYQELR